LDTESERDEQCCPIFTLAVVVLLLLTMKMPICLYVFNGNYCHKDETGATNFPRTELEAWLSAISYLPMVSGLCSGRSNRQQSQKLMIP